MSERKGLVSFEFKAEKEGTFRATFSRLNGVRVDVPADPREVRRVLAESLRLEARTLGARV